MVLDEHIYIYIDFDDWCPLEDLLWASTVYLYHDSRFWIQSKVINTPFSLGVSMSRDPKDLWGSYPHFWIPTWPISRLPLAVFKLDRCLSTFWDRGSPNYFFTTGMHAWLISWATHLRLAWDIHRWIQSEKTLKMDYLHGQFGAVDPEVALVGGHSLCGPHHDMHKLHISVLIRDHLHSDLWCATTLSTIAHIRVALDFHMLCYIMDP